MKKRTILLIIIIAWLPWLIAAWDKDKPSSSTSLRASNPEILANWAALEAALGHDHEFSTGGTNSGKHEVITFEEESSAGASSTDEGHLQVIDGGSQPEMAFTSEDGDELQFTKDGDLYSSNNLVIDGISTLTGAVTADGGITFGADANLIGSATSDITFNTDKFTVAGATGNTVIAGTLDVTGNIDPTTYETTNGGFLDEDNMASDAADKVSSQQSIKAYSATVPKAQMKVDNVAGATFGSGNESVTHANGLIIKMGTEASLGAKTFDRAFPTACVSITLTATGTLAYLRTFSVSKTGYTSGANTATAYYWIAVGY